jgi:hypothetical protein
MTNDTKIAIINGNQPEVAAAIASLPTEQQNEILSNGGSITLASGKSPSGLDCTLVARVATNLDAKVFAVSPDGREQPVAAGNVAKIAAMLAK